MILIAHLMVYRASTRWSTGRPPVGLLGVHPVDKYGLLGGRKTGPTSGDDNSETVHPKYLKFGVWIGLLPHQISCNSDEPFPSYRRLNSVRFDVHPVDHIYLRGGRPVHALNALN